MSASGSPIHNDASSPQDAKAGFWRSVPGLGLLLDRMGLIAEKQHERHHLLELNDDQLKDVGLSRTDARHEGDRHFWE